MLCKSINSAKLPNESSLCMINIDIIKIAETMLSALECTLQKRIVIQLSCLMPCNSFILFTGLWACLCAFNVFFLVLPRLTFYAWWQMSESEKMTHHTLLSASQQPAIRHVMFIAETVVQPVPYTHTHTQPLSPHLFVCARSESGRYAFVMSLSSHFSIQIQNNCVIMNVDTNQHTHTPFPFTSGLAQRPSLRCLWF